MTINKTRKLLIAIVAILGAFTAMQANAEVLSVIPYRGTASYSTWAQHASQEVSTYPLLQFRTWASNSSSGDSAGIIGNVAVFPRMTGTSTPLTMTYSIDNSNNSKECYIYSARVTLTTTYPQIYQYSLLNSAVVATTSDVSMGVVTYTPTYDGALGSSGHQQNAVTSGADTSHNGVCTVTIHSIKQSSLELLGGRSTINISASSGGSGGTITFPEEPLITHDVGTTLALSTLIGIMSILTMLYVVRNH